MDYLKNYNLNDSDINDIISNIDERDKLELEVHESNISKILDYFVKRSINIKNLLMYKPYLFYMNSNTLIEKLNNIESYKLIQINDNIDLIDELL